MNYTQTLALLQSRSGSKGQTVFCEALGTIFYWFDYVSGAPTVDDINYVATGNGGQTRWVSIGVGTAASSQLRTFKNELINGNFDIWQRNTTQTSSGIGSDDRWTNTHGGSTTKTHSRQSFTLGQTDVPNNPRYYSRTVVTTGSGASDYCLKAQRIKGVSKLSGQTVTLSFWAKADASKNIAVEFEQFFGTGGSPSTTVSSLGVTTKALTTSRAPYDVTVTLPSVSGKTLGTDNNDCLIVNFWFEAGSTFNARTNSLGNQSGTFELSQVQLEVGSIATEYDNYSEEVELYRCLPYFEKSFNLETTPSNGPNATSFSTDIGLTRSGLVPWASGGWGYNVMFSTKKIRTPTITAYGNSSGYWCYSVINTFAGSATRTFHVNLTPASPSKTGFIIANNVSTNAIVGALGHWTADAEI